MGSTPTEIEQFAADAAAIVESLNINPVTDLGAMLVQGIIALVQQFQTELASINAQAPTPAPVSSTTPPAAGS